MSLTSTALNAFFCLRHRALTRKYKKLFGRSPNYIDPVLYNDKIQWRKLFDRNPMFPVFLDKISVRDHVSRTVPELKLPELLWTGTNPDEIPYSALPEQYVVKPNCRSGCYYFVLSPADIKPELIAAQCRTWLATPYGQGERQWAYKQVKRRLLVEEFLVTHTERNHVRDFRFHVFDGRVHLITAVSSRLINGSRVPVGDNAYYDRDWNQWPFINAKKQSTVPAPLTRPPQLDSLIAAAESLGNGIDHIRVDLYLVRGQPYFGEITVYPLSGLGTFTTMPGTGLPPVEDYEIHMGRPWQLPDISTGNKLYRGLFD